MTTGADTLKQYEVGAFQFGDRDYYDRHLVFDPVVRLEDASRRERFEALACEVRDVLTQRWLLMLGQVLQRPHDSGVCDRDLEGEAVPDRLRPSGIPRGQSPYNR